MAIAEHTLILRLASIKDPTCAPVRSKTPPPTPSPSSGERQVDMIRAWSNAIVVIGLTTTIACAPSAKGKPKMPKPVRAGAKPYVYKTPVYHNGPGKAGWGQKRAGERFKELCPRTQHPQEHPPRTRLPGHKRQAHPGLDRGKVPGRNEGGGQSRRTGAVRGRRPWILRLWKRRRKGLPEDGPGHGRVSRFAGLPRWPSHHETAARRLIPPFRFRTGHEGRNESELGGRSFRDTSRCAFSCVSTCGDTA